MLDTRFPRLPGDVGHPLTYARAGIPVRFLVVEGASPRRIVQEADPRLVQPFVDAAIRLADDGASMITTSCGFLAAYQEVLAQAVPVPVLSSSLLQASRHARPGILTFDAKSLTPRIMQAASVPAGTPVAGLAEGCEFHRRILNNDSVLDFAEAARNIVDAAKRLVRNCSWVQTIVLECTNMPPYREAVAAATGLDVHDIETLILSTWKARISQQRHSDANPA